MNQKYLHDPVMYARNARRIDSMTNTNKFFDTFGKRVRLLRDDASMTQNELRDAIELQGVSVGQSYVSQWERSDTIPGGEVVAAVARALRTTTDYLLMLTDDPEIKTEELPAEIDALSEEAEQVAQIVDEMKPERRADALAIVRDIYKREDVGQNQLRRFDILFDRIYEREGLEGVRRAEELLVQHFGSARNGSRTVA